MADIRQKESLNGIAAAMQAGCSAICWPGGDGRRLYGRNFDFDRLAQGTGILFVPAGQEYQCCIDAQDDRPSEHFRSRYAAMGMGLMLPGGTAAFYDGINEKGLMGAQLYYRNFAHFEAPPAQGTRLQPPLLVTHFLSQCATVEEAVTMLQQEVTLCGVPLLGTVPPLHWMFSDRGGEAVVIESDADGLHIYRNSIGVMTNSPGYAWHRTHLLCFSGVQDADRGAMQFGPEVIESCFSGSGCSGLPGDWSSPSRFVRLAFLQKYAQPGADEATDVANLFHALQSAAFPLGMVRVEQAPAAAHDADIRPFDYTVYSGVMCADSLSYYWTSYENQRIQGISMKELQKDGVVRRFELGRTPDILMHAPEEGQAL